MISKSRILRAIVLLIDIAVVTYSKRRKKDDIDVSTLELEISSNGIKTRARPQQNYTKPLQKCKGFFNG